MKTQTESSVMKGHAGKRFDSVVKAATKAGDSAPAKAKGGISPDYDSESRRSFRIECVLGGFKLCWNKNGTWQSEEGIATTVDEALDAARAYLENADED